jgi:hypothetical protein
MRGTGTLPDRACGPLTLMRSIAGRAHAVTIAACIAGATTTPQRGGWFEARIIWATVAAWLRLVGGRGDGSGGSDATDGSGRLGGPLGVDVSLSAAFGEFGYGLRCVGNVADDVTGWTCSAVLPLSVPEAAAGESAAARSLTTEEAGVRPAILAVE